MNSIIYLRTILMARHIQLIHSILQDDHYPYGIQRKINLHSSDLWPKKIQVNPIDRSNRLNLDLFDKVTEATRYPPSQMDNGESCICMTIVIHRGIDRWIK